MRKWNWRKLALVGLASAATACVNGGDIVGPDAVSELVASSLGVGADTDFESLAKGNLPAVTRLSPMIMSAGVTVNIGPAGGVVRSAGVELQIPAGALSATTSITMLVPAGPYVQVQLFPHGLTFAVPAELRFDVSDTRSPTSSHGTMIGAYFTSPILQGLIQPVEVFRAVRRDGWLRFQIQHFSEYAPAWGRGYTAAGG